MRGLGDSKSPFFFVLVASVFNIVLDVVLVGPLGIGTMGAGKIERIKETVRIGVWLNMGITALTIIMIQIFAGPIISLFNLGNPAVLENGILYLRICCSLNGLIYAVMYTYDSFATGIGAATFAMFNSLLDSIVVRLFLSFLLGAVLEMGFVGIYIGQALSPVLPAIIGFCYFRSKRWELFICVMQKKES